jgi:hypothetical protein
VNLIDPFGLETQYSLNVLGALGLPLSPNFKLGAGVSGGLGIGISIGDSFWDTQIFIIPRAAGMVTAGAYGGIGLAGEISQSDGPLPIIQTTNTFHVEANAGWGLSGGAPVDFVLEPCDEGTFFSDRNVRLTSISAGGGRIGAGYGAMLGAGLQTATTISTPTFGNIAEMIMQIFN